MVSSLALPFVNKQVQLVAQIKCITDYLTGVIIRTSLFHITVFSKRLFITHGNIENRLQINFKSNQR